MALGHARCTADMPVVWLTSRWLASRWCCCYGCGGSCGRGVIRWALRGSRLRVGPTSLGVGAWGGLVGDQALGDVQTCSRPSRRVNKDRSPSSTSWISRAYGGSGWPAGTLASFRPVCAVSSVNSGPGVFTTSASFSPPVPERSKVRTLPSGGSSWMGCRQDHRHTRMLGLAKYQPPSTIVVLDNIFARILTRVGFRPVRAQESQVLAAG